jgi:hypothetical protein
MAYIDLNALALDATFRNRLQPAICAAANNIAAEAASAHNRVDEKRHYLATLVLADGGAAKLSAFAFSAVSVNPAWTTAAPPTDAQIDTAISSIWNNLAGVSAADRAS